MPRLRGLDGGRDREHGRRRPALRRARTAHRAARRRGSTSVPPKQRAALALLLLHRGRFVSTDRLVDACGARPPPQRAGQPAGVRLQPAARAARQRRREFADRPPRAGLCARGRAEALDLRRFAAAAREARGRGRTAALERGASAAEPALALWRGELLEDLSDQEWVRAEAQAIEELSTECRETQITALLAAQRVAPALAAAQELRAAHPLRDRACWLRCSRCTARAARRTRWSAYRATPSASTRSSASSPAPSCGSCRSRSCAMTPPSPPGRGPRAGRRRAADTPEPHARAGGRRPSPPSRASLVGRARETRVLDEVLAAPAPAVRWLVLTGPAGIGKTRLAEELVARARDEAAACGRAARRRTARPRWWPIRQLVRALGDDPDTLLVPPATPTPTRPASPSTSASPRCCGRRPPAPLIVVVDDVQWADATSAALPRAPRRRAERRADRRRAHAPRRRADPGDRALLAALARSDGHRQLAVGPLAPDAVRELRGASPASR